MPKSMLYPIKPGCFRPREDGTSIIHIQYCYTSTKKTLLDTKIRVPVECWDSKKQMIKSDLPPEFGNARKLNEALDEQVRLIEELIKYTEKRGIDDKGGFVKTYYAPELDIYSLDDLVKKDEQKKIVEEIEKKKAEINVFNQIDLYIKSKINKVSKGMPAIYRNMKDHLLAYQTARKVNLTFESFTLDFYEDFVEFLSHEYVQSRFKVPIVGLKINTVGKTINQLRIFLINRAKRKIIAPIDLSDWHVFNEEVDAEYLSWEEIEMVWKLDLSGHPHFVPYRDDFVLGCLTGLRFSDFSVLESPDIRGEFLYKKQQKSSHRVVIPLRQAAKDILENRFKRNYEPLTNVEFNRHIKTICKMAGITERVKHTYTKGNKKIDEVKPKCEWITTHTCRRSFCTNEFLAGTPVELIMKISGHKSTKDFYRYIRISPEQAAMKVKEIWDSRDSVAMG